MGDAGSWNLFCLLHCSIWLTPPLFGLLTVTLFCLLWQSPEIYQLISDLFTGDSPLARAERDRELEGRLFDPEHRPSPGEPLIETTPSKTGFPEFPFQHTFHFL